MKEYSKFPKPFVLLFLFSGLFFASSVFAAQEDSFSLTITPPLFQLTVSPGEVWSSSIKVVNNNPYDVDIYASPMNFVVADESGIGRLVPSLQTATTSFTLASWISVEKGPIHIPAEKTGTIPFSLIVPANAEPGGHYGAILTGNQPPAVPGSNTVNVSTSISSLFLVRVNGDMIESGRIREFSLDKLLYDTPKVNFSLRFENKGNVHLLPRGEIVIRNMWGKERGKILINQDTDFGNVLPHSIRKFQFEWSGEDNFFEVGRYTALATLSFGEQTRDTEYQEVSFWVIPIVPALKILGFLILFIGFFVWSIRRYVRKALMLESERIAHAYGADTAPEIIASKREKQQVQKNISRESVQIAQEPIRVETLIRPIALGVVDLRSAMSKTPTSHAVKEKHTEKAEHLTLSKFMRKYKVFFISILLILAGLYGIRAYFDQVLTYKRNYNVKIKREDGAVLKPNADAGLKAGDITIGN
jgi:hypothetical protein